MQRSRCAVAVAVALKRQRARAHTKQSKALTETKVRDADTGQREGVLGYVTKRRNDDDDDDGDDDDATKCNAKRNENGDGCRTTDAISLGCAAPKRRRRLVVELSMTKRAKQRDRARERGAERTKAARDAQRA